MWQPKVDGRTHDVPIETMHTPGAFQSERLLHLYPGLGEEERATEKGLHVLADEGLPALGIILPFHHLPPEQRHIERVVAEAPYDLAVASNERAGNNPDYPVDAIGSSQGGGVLLMSARRRPEAFDAMGLLGPVGLNPEAFGNTDRKKAMTFLWRLGVVNALFRKEQSLLLDPKGNIDALRETGGRVISDVREGRLGPKISFALNAALAQNVAYLAGKRELAVFVGENDPVFRPDELREELNVHGAGHVLEVIEGSHGTLNNRGGRNQLRHVAQWMRQVREDRADA